MKHSLVVHNPGYLGSLIQVPAPVVYQDSFYSIPGDGVDGLVSIPHSSNYNFNRTDAFTICFAVKFNSSDLATNTSTLTKYDQVNIKGWYIQKISSKLRFVMAGASGNNIVLDATSFTYVANKWYHIGIRHDGTSLASGVTVLIDGVTIAMTVTSNTLTQSITNTLPIELFHRNNTAGFSKDIITHVQLFNTALHIDQIGNLWGGLLFDKNPIAHYPSCVLNWFVDDLSWNGTQYSGSGTTYASGVASSVTVSTTGISNGTRTLESMDIYDETNCVFDTRSHGDIDRLLNFNAVQYQNFYSYRSLRTYITFKQKGGVDAHDLKRIMYWDHQTNKPSKNFSGGTGKLLTDDNHLTTTVFESALGYVFCAYEFEHNTSVIIKRSTVKYDLETLVQVAEIQAGATDTSTSPLAVSYPTWKEFANGEIWIFFRYGRSQFAYSKSLDDGQTWGSMQTIMNADRNNTAGGADNSLNWVYPYIIQTNDDSIRAAFIHTGSATQGDNGLLYFVSYMESTDRGVTWKNISGSFSKNISVSGRVTYAEMLASCKFDDQYALRAVSRAPNGTVYIVGVDISGNNYLWYYSGGSWTRKTISFLVVTASTGYMIIATDAKITITGIETVSSKNLPGEYESTDQGTSWTLTRRFSVDNTKNYNFPMTQLQDVPPDKRIVFAGIDNGNLLITT